MMSVGRNGDTRQLRRCTVPPFAVGYYRNTVTGAIRYLILGRLGVYRSEIDSMRETVGGYVSP